MPEIAETIKTEGTKNEFLPSKISLSKKEAQNEDPKIRKAV